LRQVEYSIFSYFPKLKCSKHYQCAVLENTKTCFVL